MSTNAYFKFALDSLEKCVLMKPKNNIFFSPHLIYQNLLIIYFATTDENIENSLQQILYIPKIITKNRLKTHYMDKGIKQFCYAMYGPENSYVCHIFSRIYISKCKYQLLKGETLSLFSSGHQAIKSCDVESNPDGIRVFINSNVSSVTQNKKLKLLPPYSVDSKTDIVLANAIYLNGQLSSYKHDISRLDDILDISKFQIKNDSQSGDKDKIKELTIFLMEIPLKENKISVFFIWSPALTEQTKTVETEKDTITELIKYLTTEEGSLKLRLLLNRKSQKQTRIFPIFKIEYNLQMNELLEMLGVPELTPSGRAELSAFTDGGNLTLGNAVHQASIEMTEDSITATASNAFFTANSNCQHVQTTNISTDIDYPCICLIYDKVHHNILFCGILWNLSQGS